MDTVWLHRFDRHRSYSLPDLAECSRLTLVFDADNTLWDTNAVFVAAQRVLVDELVALRPSLDPQEGMRELQTTDQALIQRFGRAEYDFVWLWRALAGRYLESPGGAAGKSGPVENEEQVMARFAEQLQAIPPLLPNVLTTLEELRQPPFPPMAIGIFSEGRASRLTRIFQAHPALTDWADFVVIGDKSEEQYRALAAEPEFAGQRRYMVGDSLKKDIGNAKAAGYRTMYIPSEYTVQNEALPIDADHVLTSIREVPQILREVVTDPHR